MPRPPISETIVQTIENIWAENHQPSAQKVYELAAMIKERPSLRKVQQIVRDAKRRAKQIPDDPPIVPWTDATVWPQDPTQVASLFLVMRVALLEVDRRLTVGEARWVTKLSGLFDYNGLGCDEEYRLAYVHFVVAHTYARRERAGEILERPAKTDDLDGLTMFRPWAGDERFRLYRAAIQDGLIPDYDPAATDEADEKEWPGHTQYRISLFKAMEYLEKLAEEKTDYEGNTETEV